MKFWKHALVVVAAALAGLPQPGIAQSLDPAAIEHPVPDSWPTYHGD
jgi:alcohol dehydrogenase (cytochrome c)